MFATLKWFLVALAVILAVFFVSITVPGFSDVPEATVNVPIEEAAAPAPEPAREEVPAVSEAIPDETADVPNLEQTLQETLSVLQGLRSTGTGTQPIENLNETVRESVVNVLCTTKGAGPFNPVSASGVVIHPDGIILTNAHVAQYFLLENYPTPGFVDCVIRTGSPAKPAYTAELLFISPSWIAENAEKIDDARPTGSGEHDWALLQVTGLTAAPTVPAPAQFPHLPISLFAPDVSVPVILAAYPAGFLGGVTIQKELYAVSANADVEGLYTFGGNTADLFSIGGSIVAQQGASGGAVARVDGALTGLITTSSDAETTGERDLRALSTEYIIRDFENERGIALEDYLMLDLAEERTRFSRTVAPILRATLVNVLEN